MGSIYLESQFNQIILEFLRVDPKNELNDINIILILWTVRHLCPSGDCFIFNCYCRHSSLVLINRDGAAAILHSREGLT